MVEAALVQMIGGTLIILFLFLSFAQAAELPAGQDEVEISFPQEAERFRSNLFSWESGYWLAAASIATPLAQTQDYAVRDRVSEGRLLSSQTSRWGDIAGMGFLQVGLAATQYLVGQKGIAVRHAEALAMTTISVWLMKGTFARSRPDSHNHESMPSGHTAISFATAGAVWHGYGWKWGLATSALASFVALTRLTDDAHWLSDTVLGAATGLFWSRVVHKGAHVEEHSEDPGQAKQKWFLLPALLSREDRDLAPGLRFVAAF